MNRVCQLSGSSGVENPHKMMKSHHSPALQAQIISMTKSVKPAQSNLFTHCEDSFDLCVEKAAHSTKHYQPHETGPTQKSQLMTNCKLRLRKTNMLHTCYKFSLTNQTILFMLHIHKEDFCTKGHYGSDVTHCLFSFAEGFSVTITANTQIHKIHNILHLMGKLSFSGR